jgi:cysteine desulfuration protein SufE
VPDTRMPSQLAEIAEDFGAASPRERLDLLLEFSDDLPDLPHRYADAPDRLEQVHECQSPLFLVVEVDDEPADEPGQRRVHLFFQAPREAPTTRGFAGILHQGLDGLSVEEVLSTPDDAPMSFSLAEAVSPLRLRGMVAMLSRIKRQTALKSGLVTT